MLGDEEEKKPSNSMNPLKRARQRRNTKKTVQFTAPSYVEPSDIEYSTEEEGEGDGDYLGQEQDGENTQEIDQGMDPEGPAAIEPLRPRDHTRDIRHNGENVDGGINSGNLGNIHPVDDLRTSDETFECPEDSTAAKSRKGTLRNTDSFFKDDSVETRKINLTPSLLRDDSKGTMTTSIEAIDVSPSLLALRYKAKPQTA